MQSGAIAPLVFYSYPAGIVPDTMMDLLLRVRLPVTLILAGITAINSISCC